MQNLDVPDAGLPTTTTHLLASLLISLAASIGSVQDIVHNLKTATPFKTVD
jgi:hypothetical protein